MTRFIVLIWHWLKRSYSPAVLSLTNTACLYNVRHCQWVNTFRESWLSLFHSSCDMCFCFYSFISSTSQPISPTPWLLLVSQLMSLIWELCSSPSLHIQSNIPRGPLAEFGQRLKARAMGNWRSLSIFNILTFNPNHCHVLPLSLFLFLSVQAWVKI